MRTDPTLKGDVAVKQKPRKLHHEEIQYSSSENVWIYMWKISTSRFNFHLPRVRDLLMFLALSRTSKYDPLGY